MPDRPRNNRSSDRFLKPDAHNQIQNFTSDCENTILSCELELQVLITHIKYMPLPRTLYRTFRDGRLPTPKTSTIFLKSRLVRYVGGGGGRELNDFGSRERGEGAQPIQNLRSDKPQLKNHRQ